MPDTLPPRRLAAVPDGPAGAAPVPEPVPGLLAALDAGDEEAVRQWFRTHAPAASSLAFYGLLLAAGLVGLLEWPAVAVAALGLALVDHHLGGVEKVVADLRAQLDRRA